MATLVVTAELSEEAVVELLSDLLPVTVDLDPLGADAGRRWIRIERAHHVDFVPEVGLRVRTGAVLQWTAIGLAVPATLNEVALLVRPVVVVDERGPKLVFRPSLEHADVKFLPRFVDEAITGRINAALEAEGDLIGWHFGESLAQRVPLPSNLSPVDAFRMTAGDLAVRVHEHGLVLKLTVNAGFSRGREAGDPEALPGTAARFP